MHELLASLLLSSMVIIKSNTGTAYNCDGNYMSNRRVDSLYKRMIHITGGTEQDSAKICCVNRNGT